MHGFKTLGLNPKHWNRTHLHEDTAAGLKQGISGARSHLGVSARVQSGNLVWGGNSQRVHSKQGVTPG